MHPKAGRRLSDVAIGSLETFFDIEAFKLPASVPEIKRKRYQNSLS
jgi:hypothetical protein